MNVSTGIPVHRSRKVAGARRWAAPALLFSMGSVALTGAHAAETEHDVTLRIVQRQHRVVILTPSTAVVLSSSIELPERDTTGPGTLEYDDATGSVVARIDGVYELDSTPNDHPTRVSADHTTTRARYARVSIDLDPAHVATFDPEVVMNRFFSGSVGVALLDTTCQKSTGRVCLDDDCLAISRGGGTYRCGGLVTLNPQGGGSGTVQCFADEYACFNCHAGYLIATCKDLYHCDKYSETCRKK